VCIHVYVYIHTRDDSAEDKACAAGHMCLFVCVCVCVCVSCVYTCICVRVFVCSCVRVCVCVCSCTYINEEVCIFTFFHMYS